MAGWTSDKLAPLIDHTLLRADASPAEIDRLCDEAVEHGFATVCINPYHVARASKHLSNTRVGVCTVVDFPLGAGTSGMKAFCAKRSVESGAQELDMVMNLSAMKSGLLDVVEADIRTVVEAVPDDIVVKVILETALLDEKEIATAGRLALRAGADFIKTSTGFGPGGATVKAVRIMKEAVGSKIGIKAAGGIKDSETAIALIESGATRLGTSASLKIIDY